jgi:integrase
MPTQVKFTGGESFDVAEDFDQVNQQLSQNEAGSTMRRACTAAGLAHYHPHDLRHRYASVKIAEGVPVTTLAAQLGHSKKSMTLDTYSHVLVD